MPVSETSVPSGVVKITMKELNEMTLELDLIFGSSPNNWSQAR